MSFPDVLAVAAIAISVPSVIYAHAQARAARVRHRLDRIELDERTNYAASLTRYVDQVQDRHVFSRTARALERIADVLESRDAAEHESSRR